MLLAAKENSAYNSVEKEVNSDAKGGIKGAAHCAAPYGGLGAGSHQQARVGIYRAIACRYYTLLL